MRFKAILKQAGAQAEDEPAQNLGGSQAASQFSGSAPAVQESSPAQAAGSELASEPGESPLAKGQTDTGGIRLSGEPTIATGGGQLQPVQPASGTVAHLALDAPAAQVSPADVAADVDASPVEAAGGDAARKAAPQTAGASPSPAEAPLEELDAQGTDGKPPETARLAAATGREPASPAVGKPVRAVEAAPAETQAAVPGGEQDSGIAPGELACPVQINLKAGPISSSHAVDLVEQITRQVESLVHNNRTTLNIQIAPAELGRIQLHLTSDPQGLRITLTADQPVTCRLLADHLGNLRQVVEKAGIQLANLGVGSEQPSWHGSGESPREALPAQHAGASEPARMQKPVLATHPMRKASSIDYLI